MKITFDSNNIYKTNRENDYQQLYNYLKKTLAPDCFIFAKYTASMRYYHWEINDDFQCLANATDEVKKIVLSNYTAKKQQILLSFVDKNVQVIRNLFSDNEKFIYYSPDNLNNILIIAWGFKYQRQINNRPAISNVNKKQNTKQKNIFSFSKNGNILPNFEFDLILKDNQTNRLKTDSNGTFSLKLNIDENIKLLDPNTNLQYEFNIKENINEYKCEIKEIQEKIISPEKDIINENIVEEDIVEEDIVEAIHDPEPSKECNIKINIKDSNKRVTNYLIEILHNATKKQYQTDLNGSIMIYDFLINDSFTIININNPENQLQCKIDSNNQEFDFYLEYIQETESNINFTFIDSNHKPLSNEKISFDFNNEIIEEYILDNEGKLSINAKLLNNIHSVSITPLIDKRLFEKTTINLIDNETEYRIEVVKPKLNIWMIILEIIVAIISFVIILLLTNIFL